jgi:hypothetical protein
MVNKVALRQIFIRFSPISITCHCSVIVFSFILFLKGEQCKACRKSKSGDTEKEKYNCLSFILFLYHYNFLNSINSTHKTLTFFPHKLFMSSTANFQQTAIIFLDSTYEAFCVIEERCVFS